jgi:hypothetical protein
MKMKTSMRMLRGNGLLALTLLLSLALLFSCTDLSSDPNKVLAQWAAASNAALSSSSSAGNSSS